MVPTYNQPQYIEQCLDSALAQDYPNLEIVVSDDSSNDETERIVQEKYIQDPKIKYFHNKVRLGRVGNYHHTLYEKATGEYALNLDGDDWLTDNTYISNAVEILEKHNDVVCVIANICINYVASGEVYCLEHSFQNDTILDGKQYLKLTSEKKAHFNHMSVVYRRSLAMDIGFYNTDTVWTDSQSLFRLIYLGKVAVLNKYVGTWRIHDHNESSSFYENVQVDELFVSEQSVYDFFKSQKNNSTSFDAYKWLSNWKFEHANKFIIYHLKMKQFSKVYRLLKYLIRNDKKFLLENLFPLCGVVLIRTTKFFALKIKKIR